MTISTTTSRISYNGNGVTTVFAVPFRFFANSDLVVQLVTISTGASTTLTPGTHYTVTGADDEDGGSLTMVTAPAVGQRLVIRRVIPATQEVDYIAGDPFPAETHEQALDRLTMLAQQGEEVNARALVFPSGDTASGELPNVAVRALRLLGFDAAGNLVVSAPASGSAAELALDLAGTGGAGLVGFQQAGAGAVARTAQSKLREHYSVFDAGALGNNVADDTAAQNTAVTQVQSSYDPVAFASQSPANGPCELFYPSGYYRTNGAINVSKKVAFKGDGPAEFSSGSRVVQFAPANDLFSLVPIAQGASVSFEDMTLIAIGGGSGSLISVQKGVGTAAWNSQRYYGLVFGTPARYALRIDAGNDIIIDNCLFDVAALSTISLGVSIATSGVSDVRMTNSAFFNVAQKCIEAYHVDGLQIIAAQVFRQDTSTTQYFIDGINSLPYLLKDISIIGGNFKRVECLAALRDVNRFTLSGVSADNFGAGAGSTLNGIQFDGTCSGVTITGNTLKGSFDTRSFYSDFGAVVTGANITGNTFINTGGTGPALVCADTSGVIANNTFVGFVTPSVSELVTTTGLAINPGIINPLSEWSYTATVSGARQGDRVEVGSVSLTWPAPIGVEIQSFVSAPNTVTISYRNVTSSLIGVPQHDIRYCVTRGQ